MNRYKDIDLLKAIAIFGVIIIHTSSTAFSYPIASFNWTCALFWASIVRASVPIFFMCSGVLFLSPLKKLSIKKLYSKNILRIIVAMLFWSFLYKLYNLYASNNLTIENLVNSIKEILLFKQEFHFYYLHIILIFYILLPIVRVFTKYASKQELQYGLFVWFLLAVLYPSIKPFWPFNLLNGILDQWLLNMTYASIGYGLLGYYIKNYGISIRYSIIYFVIGIFVVFGGTYFMSLYKQTFYQGFLEGMSVGTAFLATGIFGFCTHWIKYIKRTFLKIITFISNASFCIYLIHIFFINIFQYLGINTLILPPIISIPVIALLNLILSSIVYILLSKIPIINKWII